VVGMAKCRAEVDRAVRAVERWLDTLEPDDPGTVDLDPSDLWRISALALGGAPDPELTEAVGVARSHGWSWGPIALLVGETPDSAHRRFGEPSFGC